MDEEYRVKVSVRNNLILQAIENAGYTSVKKFCDANDLHVAKVRDLILFRAKPLNSSGEFSSTAKQLMEIFGAAPSDLWTLEQLELRLTKHFVERRIGQAELNAALGTNQKDLISVETPEDIFTGKQKKIVVKEALEHLLRREKKVIEMWFGLNGADQQTSEEIGDMFDVSRSRVSQIQLGAICRLRRYAERESNNLKEFQDD